MATPPPVPAVPDADRYWSANIGANTASASVPFAVYGDGTDIDVRFDGELLDPTLWLFFSAANPGYSLDLLPRPITDGVINFNPALAAGLLEIIGDTHPRQLVMSTTPGIARREFNQTVGSIVSTMRELWRGVKQAIGAGIAIDAEGPLAARSNYDTVSPPFVYLQTDDAQGRPILYAKLSSASGDWSGPLNQQGQTGAAGTNGTNGTNGANGAYAANDPIVTMVASTDYIPIQHGGVSERVLRDTLLNQIPPGQRVASLWTGDSQGCGNTNAQGCSAIMADGTLRAWGYGVDSGNGDTNAGNRWIPKTVLYNPLNTVQPTLPFVQVARAGTALYALDSVGLVYALGGNNAGQLGVGDTVNRKRLTLVASLQAAGIIVAEIITQVAVFAPDANSTVYFRTSTGQVYAAGSNASGQIGDGTSTNRPTPTRCGTLTNIIKLAVSGDSAASLTVMALDSAGNLYAWGTNGLGQIGDGSTTNRTAPFLSLTAVLDMAVSVSTNGSTEGGHAIAVMIGGTVKVIGYNATGQLGQNNTTTLNVWTLVAGITTASKAYAGGGPYGISAVLLTAGNVILWGSNGQGQIGNGGSTSVLAPYTPSGAFQGKVTGIHFHGYYSNVILAVLICSDGTIWGSGYNVTGALGQANGLVNISTFMQIAFPPGVTSPAIAVKTCGGAQGDAALMVQLSDGTLWATGSNPEGRLGTQVGNLHTIDGLERVIFT